MKPQTHADFPLLQSLPASGQDCQDQSEGPFHTTTFILTVNQMIVCVVNMVAHGNKTTNIHLLPLFF